MRGRKWACGRPAGQCSGRQGTLWGLLGHAQHEGSHGRAGAEETEAPRWGEIWPKPQRELAPVPLMPPRRDCVGAPMKKAHSGRSISAAERGYAQTGQGTMLFLHPVISELPLPGLHRGLPPRDPPRLSTRGAECAAGPPGGRLPLTSIEELQGLCSREGSVDPAAKAGCPSSHPPGDLCSELTLLS